MAKKRRHIGAPPENRAAEFDMTPMIDVTFQLIVFFLVANDLSRKEVVDLELPQAIHGIEDKATEEYRVILNVIKPQDPNNPSRLPEITVRGEKYDLQQLARLLQTRADLKREPPGGPGAPSEVYALIRADRTAPWQHIQYVMQVCADPKIAIYKLQFATTKTSDGKPSFAESKR